MNTSDRVDDFFTVRARLERLSSPKVQAGAIARRGRKTWVRRHGVFAIGHVLSTDIGPSCALRREAIRFRLTSPCAGTQPTESLISFSEERDDFFALVR